MKSAQIGWTEGIINNYLGKRIDTDPCKIVVMFPKEGAAKEFAREKFHPMVEATDCLRDKIDLSRGRSGGNTLLHKDFPGGFLKLVGSNSTSSVKSTSAPVVVVEEPDDANSDLKGQGNTIKLLIERTKTYHRRKVLYGGTPTIKGVSEVELAYARSDQRKLYVPCHDCGESHVLSFDNLRVTPDPDYHHEVYGNLNYQKAFYACPECGSIWNDNDRIGNVRKAKWKATATSETPGFFINELYSPFPGSTHAELAKKRIEAEKKAEAGDTTDLITFVNSSEGLPYEYKTDAPEADELKAKELHYREKTIPKGGVVLTAGIDIQHNRIAIILRAWGRGEESWLVHWVEILAERHTSDPADPVWAELKDILFATYETQSGYRVAVTAAGIDCSDGKTNDAVYQFVRKNNGKGVKIRAVKGDSTLEKEIVTPAKKVDLKSDTKASKYGLQVHMVGGQKAMDLISERIKFTGSGPGRMHCYEGVGSEYYRQLLAEAKVPDRNRSGKLVWQQKSGVPNEVADCERYALHAARSERLHVKPPQWWDEKEQELMQGDLLGAIVTDGQTLPNEHVESPESTMAELARKLGNAY